jgi:uncharacterized delta-60 repeat protein
MQKNIKSFLIDLLIVYALLFIQNAVASTDYSYKLDRDLLGGYSLNPTSLMMQDDGKILIGDYYGYWAEPGVPAFTFLTRWNINGTLDQSFAAEVNGSVFSIAVLENGKILIGGAFTDVNGERRHNLARLNSDGTLDDSWDANTDFEVLNINLLSNGQIIVSGSFLHIGGDFTLGSGAYRNRIARLNENGSVDEVFNPNVNGKISSIIILSNGEIYITGDFTEVSGISRNKIARLNADGTVDTEFDFDGTYLSYFGLNSYQNGQAIVGATEYDSNNLAGRVTTLLRLNSDGSIDEIIEGVNGDVYHIGILDDESLLVGGFFDKVGEISVSNLARITSSGEVDRFFKPNRYERVYTMERLTSGTVLIGDRGSVKKVIKKVADEDTCFPIKNQSQGFSLVCI